jgi:hypothetical protein
MCLCYSLTCFTKFCISSYAFLVLCFISMKSIPWLQASFHETNSSSGKYKYFTFTHSKWNYNLTCPIIWAFNLFTFCDERENIRTECGGECFIQKHMNIWCRKVMQLQCDGCTQWTVQVLNGLSRIKINMINKRNRQGHVSYDNHI